MSKLPPVLILAGGIGSRLQSVVEDVPKPLAPVAGKPFVQWHLDHLIDHGINEVVISAGYKAECFEGFLETQQTNSLKLELVSEIERLGTGGAILHALRESEILADSDTFFCLNGDSFTPWEPEVLFEKLNELEGALLGLKVRDPSRYGTLDFDDRGVLKSFKEKTENPSSHYINAGVYCFQKSLFEGLSVEKCSLEYDLFPHWLTNKKTFHILKSSAKFIDIGTPESYQNAQTFFSTHT